ncbi:putative ribosome-binding factor A, mitochondrial [Vanessa tameamea]|uniref:Ribosome-binding factor A, mitochondrial n=1 Tax=Vanessa tameamea TaxID=334116 RepID=A0A8B8IDK3_VANTA|nr:putative ribosome-binding factor A, mitochondrial [Vanessa tameamea]
MLRRFYHCSCVLNNNKKQGIKLCKMLNPRSKKQWYPVQTMEESGMPSIKSLTKIKYEPGKRGVRRVAMLNKLFMKSITDLMSTGTVSMKVVGRGIEISKVKITPDFKTVNVCWVCKGNSSDEETENLLNSIAGPLRHELSTLRLMGEVPYIVFVKDKQEAQLVDLDRRLVEADYGDDYTPTEIGHLLKTEFTLLTKLSPEMKAKIKQLEEDQPIIEDIIPEMTHNVFGLDHAKIMNRLLAARKKTRDAWSSLQDDSPVISYRASNSRVANEDIDFGKQKKELAEFLLKRQILQNKIHKRTRDDRDSLNVITADQDIEEEQQYEDDYDEDDTFYYDEKYDSQNRR